MFNPVDTEAVIRDGGAAGRFPGEIHEGVAWWVAACFVVVHRTSRLAVGCDANPVTTEFFHRFCQGAINARHYACMVTALCGVEEPDLVRHLRERGPLAGAYVGSSAGPDGAGVVHIHLYDEHGQLIGENTGLGRIRRMIAEDRVPLPVNDAARGRIEEHVSPREGKAE